MQTIPFTLFVLHKMQYYQIPLTQLSSCKSHLGLISHHTSEILNYYSPRVLDSRVAAVVLGARTPITISRAELPYFEVHELRRIKITPPSSPGVGIAGHHCPTTKDHYQWNTSYNTVSIAAVPPTVSCLQVI